MYGPAADNFDLQTSHVIPAMIRKCLTARDEGSPRSRCGRRLADGASSLRGPMPRGHGARRRALRLERAGEPRKRNETLHQGFGSVDRPSHRLRRALRLGYRPAEAASRRRRLGVSRAQEAFGFNAKTSFADGLKQTVAWYLEHR